MAASPEPIAVEHVHKMIAILLFHAIPGYSFFGMGIAGYKMGEHVLNLLNLDAINAILTIQ